MNSKNKFGRLDISEEKALAGQEELTCVKGIDKYIYGAHLYMNVKHFLMVNWKTGNGSICNMVLEKYNVK